MTEGLLGRAEERVLEFQVCCESAGAFLPVTWPRAAWLAGVPGGCRHGWFFMCRGEVAVVS